MDHHCLFIAQCVGKNNVKYFIQFCIYMAALLLYATVMMFIKYYTDNVARNIGIKGITWIIIPYSTYQVVHIFLPIGNRGYEFYQIVDSLLLYVCIGFAVFALYISI